MGKLKKTKSLLKSGISIACGICLFLVVNKPIVYALLSSEPPIVSQLDSIVVTTLPDETGYNQIVVRGDNAVIIQTEENMTHALPSIEGEFITWMSQVGANWQIFLQNILTNTPIQLTFSGNNVNPQLDGGRVAWEGQVDGIWQIFFYDGIRVTQLSEGPKPKQLIGIVYNYIIYQQKTEDDKGWNLYYYDSIENKLTNLTPDELIGNSQILGNKLQWFTTKNNDTIKYTYDISTGEKSSVIVKEEKITSNLQYKHESSIKKVRENQPSIVLDIPNVKEKDIQAELEIIDTEVNKLPNPIRDDLGEEPLDELPSSENTDLLPTEDNTSQIDANTGDQNLTTPNISNNNSDNPSEDQTQESTPSIEN